MGCLICSVIFCLFCSTTVAYDNGAPHSRLPALGWSSWVALGPGAEHPVFDYCDEASVKNSVDAFMELGLYDAGYRHFHLDDCWAGPRNSSGFLTPEADHFPNGMKPVVDYVHSKGLAFGLYTCAGTQTCVGGRPGSKDHWDQDAQVWAEWGVDWVKMDWCNTKGMDPKTTYPLMSKALNKTGRPICFNMCEWGDENPWEWGYDVAQSWRMSGDHTGTWASTKSQIANTAKIPAQYTGKPYGWNDMDFLETGNYAQAAHANGKLSNMTEDEYITEFSMWAIAASPLLVTTPIMNCTAKAPPKPLGQCNVSLIQQKSRAKCVQHKSFDCYSNGTMWIDEGCRGEFQCNGISGVICDVDGDGRHTCACGSGEVTCVPWISDLQKRILLNEEVIAINQDVTPQGRPVIDGDLSVWFRALSDGSFAINFYNQEDHEISTILNFKDLPNLSLHTTASIRDLWAHKGLPDVTGRFPATGNMTLAPHSTRVFKVTPKN